ncbi:unnamed protein product [Candidula unifasciata]|uniref:Sushi domain-containing protein n=1 Tax=Candidula unifasciata TaxID=100452 RepID=A0A8S3YN46_9EUPU|nr:unnamed protein product [Candidula unifasciata]
MNLSPLPGISQDTACDCLIKAKSGYCSDPAALTDCHSTCTQVIHEVSCGQPPSAPNTELTVKNTSYGDTANYTCTQGYTYDEGDMILTCGSQGSWVGVLMSCIKVDCKQPPTVPNTDVTVNKTSYGDTANYSCIHGYAYEKGDTTLTCGWNGTWTGVLLSCTRVSCGKPPNATNASVNTTGTLYGDTATYTCLPGYTVVHGDKFLKCDASGDWVGAPRHLSKSFLWEATQRNQR